MLMTEYDYQMDVEVQREEAVQKNNQRDVRKLHALGWNLTDIANFVELPPDEVEEMLKKCEEQLIAPEKSPHIRSNKAVNILMTEYDYQTDIEVQREEAAEIANKKINQRVVRNLHALGWNLNDIANIVELSPEEVKKMLS